jgi:hypothetical protein
MTGEETRPLETLPPTLLTIPGQAIRVQVSGALLAVALLPGVGASLAGPAGESVPARWKNCTAVNKRYPHGVGKIGAETTLSVSRSRT